VNGSQYQVSLSGGNVTSADLFGHPTIESHPDTEPVPVPPTTHKIPLFLRVMTPRTATWGTMRPVKGVAA
jgi:hypothetical protein